MALTQALTTSFKSELMKALHNFDTSGGGGNTFKCALFVSAPAGTFGAATTNYSQMSTDENTGTGYTAGGNTLTNSGVSTSGTTAYESWSNTTWSTATISSRGALIYNSTNGNRAVCVLDFGSIISSTAGNFTIQFPTADASNAIIRLT